MALVLFRPSVCGLANWLARGVGIVFTVIRVTQVCRSRYMAVAKIQYGFKTENDLVCTYPPQHVRASAPAALADRWRLLGRCRSLC